MTIGLKELAKARLNLGVQILAPDDGIFGKGRRGPDDADSIIDRWVTTLLQVHRRGIVGGHIQNAPRHGKEVGLVVGGANGLETFGRLDPARREQIGHGGQGAGGRLGIANAEVQALVALQNLLQRQVALGRNNDQRAIAITARGVKGAHKHLTARTTRGLKAGLVREPAHIGLLKAHGLDQGRIVGAIEGFDLIAGLLFHIGNDRCPEGLQAGGAFRRQDRKVDGLDRGLGLSQHRRR